MANRFSADFQPLLLEDMTATLFGAELPADGLNIVCKSVGAMPEYIKDFGSLTAAVWDADNEDTNLEMGDMELLQLRMRVLDDIRVRLKNPGSVQQWRTSKTNFYLPQFPPGDDNKFWKEFLWVQSEIFVFEDYTPRFDLYSAVAATESRIAFSGWRFKLSKIPGQGRIKVWINSWPAQAG